MWNGPARRRRAFTLATCPEPVDYRREIDGLRALAVVPVILFHAGFQAFSGGFVGVDVFFVVSGYLITTVIIEDLARGAFSIATFYERRARRILPALLVTCAAVALVGWLLLLPDDLVYLGKFLAAASVFASNLTEWHLDYFTPGLAPPLRHLW